MNDNILNLLVFSVPETVLILTVSLSFLGKGHNFIKTFLYCICMVLFLVFISPYIKIHMLFMALYALISVCAIKYLYETDFVSALTSYSLAFAIFFAVENIHVQLVFAITKISPQEYVKFSLLKVVSFYILFSVMMLIAFFIRKKKINLILNTSSSKAGE